MRIQATFTALTSVASGLLMPRQSNGTTTTPNVAAAQYDGYVNRKLYTERQPDIRQLVFLPRT